MKTNEKGITLIALVVTIILILVLAGTSISMLTGENGILTKAKEAKEKTEVSSIDDQRKLAQAEALTNTRKTTYQGITLPEGFSPTKIKGEDSINEGLVITDGYGNEYVWIEVPKSMEVYKIAGVDITDFTDEEYTKIEKDLHTYAGDYRDENNYSDIYYLDNSEGWFANAMEYDKAKRKMIKSVYQNAGFWIGRYEAGSETNRTNEGNTNIRPLSKENLYPYTFVTRTQAKILAENVESGNCTSSLMFGIQWDLVLKYLEMKNVATQEALKTDSVKIGNYINSEFILTRGKFSIYGELTDWFNFNSEDRPNFVTKCKKQIKSSQSNAILLTTGATEATKLQNIYDIAGNAWEWTLEKSFDNNEAGVFRGGSYDAYSLYGPANFHCKASPEYNYSSIGFRVSIY